MEAPKVLLAAPEDRAALIRTLVLAFVTDPMTRWFFDRADDYLAATAAFFDAFGGAAFESSSAWSANGGQAAALWLPPGAAPDGERMMAVCAAACADARLDDLMVVMERMEQLHPKEAHWYLPLIGCDPAYLGSGLGGMLMNAALERVDAERLPAYLESSNPRNIRLFERHGFEVIGAIQHGSSPVMTPMFRAAR